MLVKMIRAIFFVFLQNLISDLISISVSVELIKVQSTRNEFCTRESGKSRFDPLNPSVKKLLEKFDLSHWRRRNSSWFYITRNVKVSQSRNFQWENRERKKPMHKTFSIAYLRFISAYSQPLLECKCDRSLIVPFRQLCSLHLFSLLVGC